MHYIYHNAPSWNWNNTWLNPEIASIDTAGKSEKSTRLQKYIYMENVWFCDHHCATKWSLHNKWHELHSYFPHIARGTPLIKHVTSSCWKIMLVTSMTSGHPLLIKQRVMFRTSLVPVPNQWEKNMITLHERICWCAYNRKFCQYNFNIIMIIYKKSFLSLNFHTHQLNAFPGLSQKRGH